MSHETQEIKSALTLMCQSFHMTRERLGYTSSNLFRNRLISIPNISMNTQNNETYDEIGHSLMHNNTNVTTHS